MSKYIDADKLIAFLEKEKAKHIIGGDYSDGVLDACDNILTFISTLQQDLPEVNLEKEIDDELDRNWRGHYIEHRRFVESAKYFYKLGLNAKK